MKGIIMISITNLFENFMRPWSSQNKFKMKKKKLPGTPTSMLRGSFSRIKKMNSKLEALNKRYQR